MAKIKKVAEINNKERIDINDFINDVKKADEEFAEYCNDERPKIAVSDYVLGAEPNEKYFAWQKSKDFPYKLVDKYSEMGDGKDEETQFGIFQRKSDGKLFILWMHDGGFIGPSTLTMCPYLEEVEVETKVVKKYK